MRRLLFCVVIGGCLIAAAAGRAATGRVIKMLPFYLDQQGRNELSPSLFERDAYQYLLLLNPEKRSALRFEVQWKTKGPAAAPLKIRLQLRGSARGNPARETVLVADVKGGGWFSHWTSFKLEGQAYKDFGQLTSWRATLWEGDRLLGEQKSFLW